MTHKFTHEDLFIITDKAPQEDLDFRDSTLFREFIRSDRIFCHRLNIDFALSAKPSGGIHYAPLSHIFSTPSSGQWLSHIRLEDNRFSFRVDNLDFRSSRTNYVHILYTVNIREISGQLLELLTNIVDVDVFTIFAHKNNCGDILRHFPLKPQPLHRTPSFNNYYKIKGMLDAAENGQLSVLESYVNQGYDYTHSNHYILREAAKRGHSKIVTYLALLPKTTVEAQHVAAVSALENGRCHVFVELVNHNVDFRNSLCALYQIRKNSRYNIVKDCLDELYRHYTSYNSHLYEVLSRESIATPAWTQAGIILSIWACGAYCFTSGKTHGFKLAGNKYHGYSSELAYHYEMQSVSK